MLVRYNTHLILSATGSITKCVTGGTVQSPCGSYKPHKRCVTVSVSEPQGKTLEYRPVILSEYRSPAEGKESFKKIRRSGRIKMTPYSRRKTRTVNILAGRQRRRHQAKRTNSLPVLDCKGEDFYGTIEDEIAYSYVDFMEQGCLSYWQNLVPFHKVDDARTDFSSEINSLMSRVVSDNLMTHDLMTDLAEARSSLKLISDGLRAVRHPLQSYKKARDILKSRRATHDELTSLWMQYRYAIMPIIYGVQDAWENFEKSRFAFKISRGRSAIDLSEDSPLGNPESTYLFQKREGNATIRATGKARFETSTLRLIDQTSFNVLNTTWEVIPFSLVVDWFVNVGEWIQIHSSLLADISSQRSFCYSIKLSERVTTYLHDYRPGKPEGFLLPGRTVRGRSVPDITVGTIQPSTSIQPVQVVTKEWYDRYIYNPSDVKLRPNIRFSNWKRWVDAYVLSLGPTLKLLRKLK